MKFLALTLGILILPPNGHAQDQDISLSIRFLNGVGRFHAGEIIPLELSFRASVPGTYDWEQRNYDRSGRLDIEQFHVTPPGRDPLAKYYSFGAFIGGGLGGPRELSTEPQVIGEDLNEWVALDKPGHYSLRVTSDRVTRRGASRPEPVKLESNSLEFDIVPADPAWAEQALRAAVTTVNMESSTQEEKNAAIRVLRFLDSPGSIREMVRLLATRPDDVGWQATGALAGSRQQELAVRELEEQMAAPHSAITANYLYILAKLKFQVGHEIPPPYPEKDPEREKVWNEARQKEFKELLGLQKGVYARAEALVGNKAGKAKAETLRTILERASDGTEDFAPIPGIPGEEIGHAFENLTQDEQWNLLTSFWERVRVPAMLGPLKRAAQQPNMAHQMLRDVVLRRLYDLDPHEAEPVFLEEMKHPHLDNGFAPVRGETLGLLAKQSLPEFEPMWVGRLQGRDTRTQGLDAQLVGRYATKAILEDVKKIYEGPLNRQECVTKDGFVRYFLKVDPEYGVKELARGTSSCMSNSLTAVNAMGRWKDVEPAITAQLNDANLYNARAAAELLARYGSLQAEKAMWERLRRFHAEWAERQNELVYSHEGQKRDANEAMGFQFGLVEALGKAQAWLLTEEEITELENLTLGQERENVKYWQGSSPVRVNVSVFGDQFTASVNQYFPSDVAALLQKLEQYPDGTHFVVSISGSAERTASVRKVMDEIAHERGYQVDGPEAVQ